ncbi:Hypothetical predicted protein [Cloeon dipterum]|uniref:DUF3730 domain-containing protein n=1 Tax=Cloeon dipterum TaxID=197152 RepID=A0A8S1DYU8_9INSE|nr:Hypothetical predicted protein [Cloeon dipterum]
MHSSSLIYSIGKTVSGALVIKEAESQSAIHQEPPELQILREKCKDDNYVTSYSASQGIVKLVLAGRLPVPKALSTLTSLLPSVKVHGSIISAVGELMVLDLKLRLQIGPAYKNPFNLHSPQHPLLTILKRYPNCSDEIVNQISSICNHQDKEVRFYGADLLRPVVLCMMCDPIATADNPPAYLQPLWNILLGLEDKTLLLECLPWLQVQSLTNQTLFFQAAVMSTLNGLSSDYLAIAMASIAFTMTSEGRNPQPALVALTPLLENCSVFLGSCLVIVLSHAIAIAPPNYLQPLLSKCQVVIENNKCCAFAGQVFTASVLPLMACPSLLITEPLHTVNAILESLKTAEVKAEPAPMSSHAFYLGHLAVRAYILGADWNMESLLQWLNVVKKAPLKFQLNQSFVLGAFLIAAENSTPALPLCLEILVELARSKVELVASVLTWILTRLSQEKRPECQLALLKALPRLGKQKENVSLIINTLESLKSETSLMPLVLNLYLIMWKLEPRVFPYLHKLILIESVRKPELQNHWDITRAHTIKEICLIRPSQHGKDLVGTLSGILNRCTGDSGATACSLALEAISALCGATVIDVASTWKVLAPKLAPDMRKPVVKNLCAVLGLMSELPSSHAEQSKLCTDVQTRLWYYSACGLSTEVSAAAFKALSKFTLEELYLAVVPAAFKKNLPYPPEFNKSSADSSKKPEDVLNFIPGVCWPQVLAVLPNSTHLVAKLLRDEITSLRGALQHMPGKAEPDLPRLNVYSVFLGLLSCLRKAAPEEQVVTNILQVLAEPMPKQYPPCNWAFLLKLVDQRAELLVSCLKVAASQAHVSPSALKVTETLLKQAATMNLKIEETVDLFSILVTLAKTVELNLLRNFVEAHLRSAIEFGLANEAQLETLHKIFRHIKCTLMNDDVKEINQKLLALTLEDLMSELSWKHDKVFVPYNECVSQMHAKFLNEMTKPTSMQNSNARENAIAIRTWIAANSEETALNWVNDCIEACASRPDEHKFLFQRLMPALVHNRKIADVTRDWLLQLMNQAQASLMSQKDDRSLYLFDVWSVAVLTLSGHVAYGDVVQCRETRLDLLPQATLAFVQDPNFTGLCLQVSI